jgi:hypothetical protein
MDKQELKYPSGCGYQFRWDKIKKDKFVNPEAT